MKDAMKANSLFPRKLFIKTHYTLKIYIMLFYFF